MKLTLKIAKVLVKLTHGEPVNSSAAKSKLIDELIAENIIYLNEYKRRLQERASFFIPKDIELAIKERGNRERFDKQQHIRLDAHKIEETKILDLINIINKEQKGLDQEYFIQ